MSELCARQNKDIFPKDVERICRSCLDQKGMFNVFIVKHEDSQLSELYAMISSLELEESDGLPSKLCSGCVDILKQFYFFKKRARESEIILKKTFINLEQDILVGSAVKSESEDGDAECANEDEQSYINGEDFHKKNFFGGDKTKPHAPTKDLTCTFCDLKFDSDTLYRLHRRKEADLRRKKKACPICHKFICASKLKDHINCHTKERPYECGICNEKFRFRSSLSRHKFRHEEKKPHECHICGKGFIQAPTLTDHIRTHSGEKSFICNVCGKLFVTKHALGNHSNMHRLKDNEINLDSNDLACNQCNKTFTSKMILKRHMNTHNEKKFLCSECGKKFSTKALLDFHIRVHSGIKPYVCKICNKAFTQKNSLQKHNFTHTGEKPVVCIICDKRFSQKGHLTYHMRKHSGERPYSYALDKLKQFVEVCKSNPDILHIPDLKFFKDYIESFGNKVPGSPKMSSEPKAEPKEKPAAETAEEMIESDPESELELDTTGCVEPDKLDENQKMGDPSKEEVSEEDSDKADEKRTEAMSQLSEGNIEKAIDLFTEAIELNPNSALLFAKRGQAYLKLAKPNACIRDCTRALELNCDSAAAYKFRGRAYRLLGEWELAAKDLRQACTIDFDEQIDEWLKEVTPNAKKIEEHLLKKERRVKEREEFERMERIRKAREAHSKASAEAKEEGEDLTSDPEAGAGGMPGMGDFYKLLQDPEIMSAFQDPEVSAAFQDISMNPANFAKYQSNPKVMALVSKLSSKFSGAGMNMPGFGGAGATGFPGFPGFPSGFPGAGMGGNPPPQPKPSDDDNLD
ncbi:hypothetical protein JTB14_026127 [Gonioctena quinquepunctata]|nr:hypothetical protein JTB14_026127 [Gonioctena quinquepunctata]